MFDPQGELTPSKTPRYPAQPDRHSHHPSSGASSWPVVLYGGGRIEVESIANRLQVLGDNIDPISNAMTAVPEISRYVSIYRALSAREQKVLLASLALLPLFWLGLRLAGLRRFQAWLDRSPVAQRTPLTHTEAAALGVAVNRAAKHVFGPVTCLTRSLVLRWWLLRRYGTTSDLYRRALEQGEFAAHAGGKDGIPLNDRRVCSALCHFESSDS
jgi:hypothetical protein